MGPPKLDMSNLIDSKTNLFMYLIEGLGSVHEKINVWTGPR